MAGMMGELTSVFGFKFDGLDVPVDVYRRRVRHIYLSVLPGPRLKLVMPYRCGVSVGEILERKRRWLEKKVLEIASAKKLVADGHFLFKGKEYVVKTVPGRERVVIDGGVATVGVPPRSTVDAVLRRFLTGRTADYLMERVEYFCQKLGVSCCGIYVREMGKWGYCTRGGRLCFNWRLICLPSELAEYVIAHETVHLKYFDHSKRFKLALSTLIEDYRERELGLKAYLVN